MSKPKIGMGATYHLSPDSWAMTVVWVSEDGTQIKLQRDKASIQNLFCSKKPDSLKLVGKGMYQTVEGTQRYTYKQDKNGQIILAQNTPNGWRRKLTNPDEFGGSITLGVREEFFDFNQK